LEEVIVFIITKTSCKETHPSLLKQNNKGICCFMPSFQDFFTLCLDGSFRSLFGLCLATSVNFYAVW